MNKSLTELHIAVMLFGFTAVFGELITLNAVWLVWWRVLLTSLLYLPFLNFKHLFKLSGKKIRQFSFIGVLIALHWVSFYGCIKMTNATTALVCLSTASLFTALLEPTFLKAKLNPMNLVFGSLMIPAMYLVVKSSEEVQWSGMFVGLIAALLAASFSILNKKHIGSAGDKEVSFIELGSAWLFLCILSPILLQFDLMDGVWMPVGIEWLWLVLLSGLCTNVAFLLALKALHGVSAFRANLTINLEPIYGVILAFLILKEYKEFDFWFYVGGGLVLVSVFGYSLFMRRQKLKENTDRLHT